MKLCKVRPDRSTCSACVATQEMFNVVDDCSRCKLNTDTYELLQIGTGFWSGDYAMVQKDGKITKVSLNSHLCHKHGLMMDMEELQKACETLAEEWNKALEPMEKFAKALSEAFGRMYGSEEEHRKICTGRKLKSVKRVPDVKMSTYNYKPVVKRNLPYQRRNF